MTQQVVKQSVATQVRETLGTPQMIQQLEMALPRHMTAERMIRVACTAIQKTPKLMECSSQSLIGCVVEASQLGLEPDGVIGHAYLVPFKNAKSGRTEAQLMVGYKGLIDLARRSGQVGAIRAEIVYQNETFKETKGFEPTLIHEPVRLGEDPGPMIGAYATAKLKGGDTQFVVLSVREIEKLRKRSKSSGNGPWVTDYEAMCKKTVLRQLCKLLPASVEMQSALATDELRDLGIMRGNDVIDTTANETQRPTAAPRTLDEAAQYDAEASAEPAADDDKIPWPHPEPEEAKA